MLITPENSATPMNAPRHEASALEISDLPVLAGLLGLGVTFDAAVTLPARLEFARFRSLGWMIRLLF